MISVEKYRMIVNDYSSSDEVVKARLEFLQSFCRNIIRTELDTYDKVHKEKEQK